MLVVMQRLLYVTFIKSQVRNKCVHVDNMKQLFQVIHINSIMKFFEEIIKKTLFNKI